MLAEWIIVPFLAMPTIAAYLAAKNNGKLNEHIEAALVMGIFGLFLGLFIQFVEMFPSMLGLGMATLPIFGGITIPAELSMLYFFFVFITTLVWYGISAILATAYFALRKAIPIA